MPVPENIITKTNQYYLNAWLDNSPALRENLIMEHDNLIYHDENGQKVLDLSTFYLPDILQNEHFRQRISQPNELTAQELFEIVFCYIETNKIQAAEQNEYQMYPEITELKIINKGNEKFISFTDNQNRKYRFDTSDPEFVLNLYLDLKKSLPVITLKTLRQSLGYTPVDEALTRNDFYILLQKAQRNEAEEKQVDHFIDYLVASKRNEENLSDLNCEILHNAILHTHFLIESHNASAKAIAMNKQLTDTSSIEEMRLQKQQKEQKAQEILTLKREKKAGYTNSIILLYLVLNLGLFLACLLLML